MLRTYRRRGQRHEYVRLLRDYRWVGGALVSLLIEASSTGRRLINERYTRIDDSLSSHARSLSGRAYATNTTPSRACSQLSL